MVVITLETIKLVVYKEEELFVSGMLTNQVNHKSKHTFNIVLETKSVFFYL